MNGHDTDGMVGCRWCGPPPPEGGSTPEWVTLRGRRCSLENPAGRWPPAPGKYPSIPRLQPSPSVRAASDRHRSMLSQAQLIKAEMWRRVSRFSAWCQGFRQVCVARRQCALRSGCVSRDSTRTVDGGPAGNTPGARHRRMVMRAYDFTVVTPNSRGSLANLAEELGREKINIEGLCAVDQDGTAVFHLMASDRAATTSAINKVGYKVSRETEVIVEHIENRPRS